MNSPVAYLELEVLNDIFSSCTVDSLEDFTRKTNETERSGSAEARKQEKKGNAVLFDETIVTQSIIASNSETQKLNIRPSRQVTQSPSTSFLVNHWYTVTPSIENATQKVTQSHIATVFGLKGSVPSVPSLRPSSGVTQSYVSTMHILSVTPLCATQSNLVNQVTQSNDLTLYLPEGPLSLHHVVRGNAVTQSHDYTEEPLLSLIVSSSTVTQSELSLLNAPSNAVTQYDIQKLTMQSLTAQSKVVTQSPNHFTQSLSWLPLLMAPSNRVTQFYNIPKRTVQNKMVTQSPDVTHLSLFSLVIAPSSAVTQSDDSAEESLSSRQSLQIDTKVLISEYVRISRSRCNEGDFYHHPVHCAKYLRCNHGGWQEHNCGLGTVFNPRINVCDWERNVQC